LIKHLVANLGLEKNGLDVLKSLLTKKTLKDAATVKGSRKGIGEALFPLGKKRSFWRPAQTKCHRVKPCLAKEHGIDAASRSFRDKGHHCQGNLCVRDHSDTQRIAPALLGQSFWFSTKHWEGKKRESSAPRGLHQLAGESSAKKGLTKLILYRVLSLWREQN